MKNLSDIIRKLREDSGLPLRIVAGALDIDQAILSKIERGQRTVTREQAIKLAAFYKVKEEDLLVAWLSDKIVYAVGEEEFGLEALHVAEGKVAYRVLKKTDRKKLVEQLKNVIQEFDMIEKAWIYGSFSRADDNAASDIDIALQTNEQFSYFDLAEVQNRLENKTGKKIDVGFIDSFKPYILEQLKPDLKLIYEK